MPASASSVWFLGDAHGDFRHVLRAVRSAPRKPTDLVFLGDLELSRPLGDEIGPIEDLGPRCWLIHGNHDADNPEAARFLFDSPLFPERSLHGRVARVGGLRIGGLGGVFGASSWLPPDDPKVLCERDLLEDLEDGLRWGKISRAKAEGEALKAKALIFWEDWSRLYGQSADVLVTHEAPSCHPLGFGPIDELARSMGALAAFHGHHHDRLDARYREDPARMGFVARGVGLRGISGAGGEIILPGIEDERRMGRIRPG